MAEIAKNDQVILLSAQADFKDGRFNQVINNVEHLLKKYQNSLEINGLYASALYYLKKYHDAYETVQNFADELIVYPKYQENVLNIFLANQIYMAAREVLGQAPSEKYEEWQRLIIDQEDRFRKGNGNKLAVETRNFAHLGAHSVYEQVQEIKTAQKLPLKEYVSAAKILLNDPFGWQVSKTQVLLELLKVKVSENVQLFWMDGKAHTISVDELKPLAEYQSFVNVLRKIDEKFAAEDPIKLDLLEKMLFTQSNYIYPYFDKVITEPDFWADAIAAQTFGGIVSARDSQEEQMLSWIRLIHDQEIKIGLI